MGLGYEDDAKGKEVKIMIAETKISELKTHIDSVRELLAKFQIIPQYYTLSAQTTNFELLNLIMATKYCSNILVR